MRFLVLLLLGIFVEARADVALVTYDRAAMRAAAKPAAAVHATLRQGELLEVRSEARDWLQVWDYRRERGGFVRASQVRRLDLRPEEAPALLAVVRFLRSTQDDETLGIALASLYLRIAPADGSIDEGIEALDALGAFAERIARRAVPELLDVATTYGVRFASVERGGRMRVCYEGEAFRRVLALPSTPLQRARAALALTRSDCAPEEPNPVLRLRTETWRTELLDLVEAEKLPPYLRNRILMRRAGAWSAIAFYRARGLAEAGARAAPAAQRAIAELAAVDRRELAEEDRHAYEDATRRVNATRWAAVTAPPPAKDVRLQVSSGSRPGETCLTLVDRRPVLRRCTYGVVWEASATPSAGGDALTVAVQHTETHREAWAFRRGAKGWTLRVLPRT